MGQESLRYWMAAAIVILVPYSLVLALNFNVILGKAMDIRDIDLVRLYYFIVGCGYIRNPALRDNKARNATFNPHSKDANELRSRDKSRDSEYDFEYAADFDMNFNDETNRDSSFDGENGHHRWSTCPCSGERCPGRRPQQI